MTTLVEVWRHQGGYNLSNDFVYGVAAAADNSVYLLGSKDEDGTTGSDFAAVQLDADGNYIWDWTEGSEGDDVLFSAAAVADGVVGVGNDDGMWNGALSSGGTDFVVVKLYSNGIVAWRLKGGTDEDDFLYAAVEAIDGNVVVAGNTIGSWVEINDGWNDVAVAKLDVDNGDVIWSYQSGTTGDGGAYGLAAAARGDGSIVIGGYTFGSFATDFAGESDATDFIAVALDEDGNELWRWQDGPGTGFNYIFGVAAFDDDSVLLAGLTEGSWAIDNVGQTDFALAKLSASGDLEWSWQVTKGSSQDASTNATLEEEGTAFEDEFSSAAIGIDGSVILSGYTYGSWEGIQEGTDVDRDFVAMSISAEGDVLWRYQAGSTSNDDFNDVAVRGDGSIILGGWTYGSWVTSATSDSYSDFAAVSLNATTSTTTSAQFSTPSPLFSATSLPIPSPTSPPIPSPTSSPIPSPTSSPIPSPTPPSTPYSTSSQRFSQPSPSPVATPPTANSREPESSLTNSDSGLQVGVIIGSSIGGVAVVAILIICFICFWFRDKRPEALPSPTSPFSAPRAPVIETGKPSTTGSTNGSVKTSQLTDTNPAPAYTDIMPTHTDPPPVYSSVA